MAVNVQPPSFDEIASHYQPVRGTFESLFTDWFIRLAGDAGLSVERTSQEGNSGRYVVGAPDGDHVVLDFSVPRKPKVSGSANLERTTVQSWGAEALQRAKTGDPGDCVLWYGARCEVHPANPSGANMMYEAVVGRQRKTIVGWFRINESIIVNIHEANAASNTAQGEAVPAKKILAVDIDIRLNSPRERNAFHASEIAHQKFEVVAALCSLALDRPVPLPMMVHEFPRARRLEKDLDGKVADQTLPHLVRHGAPLSLVEHGKDPALLEIFGRLRAALLTYHAGLEQTSTHAACVLFVSACEALAAPHRSWRKDRVTDRFIDFYSTMLASYVDAELVPHRNLEQVLNIRRLDRSTEKLRTIIIEKFYELRSIQVHSGLQPSFTGMIGSPSAYLVVLRHMAKEFAEYAILNYMTAPRSSLVGKA